MSRGDEVIDIVSGDLLEQQPPLSLAELCQHYVVQVDWVVELVEEGIVEPEGTRQDQWRFSGECRRRISIVRRLQRDLGVNLPGAALVLDLLDEVQALRRAQAQP
jgi:chaperone modulatory protein CbpM